MADALIRHRDGIAGPWVGQCTTVPNRSSTIGAGRTLGALGPRGGIRFRARLQSPLFGARPNEVELLHVGFSGAATAAGLGIHPVANMIRPRDVFEKQLKLVELYADLREDRAAEIFAQLGPQHAFWSAITNLHPSCTPKTFELLDAGTRFAVIVEMRFKHALACARPADLSPQVQPMLLTPRHGSLPSGHSTQAYVIARVLQELFEEAEKKDHDTLEQG